MAGRKRESSAADAQPGDRAAAAEAASGSDVQSLSFEQHMLELEGIVERLERGQNSLDQTLGDYERAMSHLRACYGRLEQAERRIEMLAGFDADGRAELVEFEDGGQGLEEQLAQGRSGRGNTRTDGGNRETDGGTPRSQRRVDDL
jgi:exodeoxyribonuclease VII small subunit